MDLVNKKIKCEKCGSEMREGELIINVTENPDSIKPIYPSVIHTGYLQIPDSPFASGEGPFWRERTGKKKGLLVKRDEMRTLRVAGLRCIKCGYTELYAKK